MNATRITREQCNTVRSRPSASPVVIKDITEMLMYEDLARARIQD
jgi:hypothetical protein